MDGIGIRREKNHKYQVLFSFFVFSSTFSFQNFPDFAKLQMPKACLILFFGRNIFFPQIEKFKKWHGSKIKKKKRKYLFKSSHAQGQLPGQVDSELSWVAFTPKGAEA